MFSDEIIVQKHQIYKKNSIRVLMQNCSASRCEHNWNVLGKKKHSKKHNSLEFQLSNYIYYIL